ncbi:MULTISPECIES: response regulator [unclassified Salinivibrio]|uniref:response regulator n=1 Tax=unclassified Salinivibrio TaxID=2636825 RepID=UPI00128E7083|nr:MULTISPECIES: response regulator [unclassified Salinivibrio]MPS31466.1 response regulator [Salinivibrio sp. VYel7]MPX92861.1 response regulator [Salinivibrio sp. VYel9]MPX95455.1 response regulator [Salinivibrio sp. VYel6]MPX99079.1 response regulator [Salinivibrio sp. VYel4]MPY02214.1 response regulator [Salinivibrio sp. VYel5]
MSVLAKQTMATLLLAVVAFAGNMISLPLFFGVHFIFGSVAVMLAVNLLGLWPAVLVALAGGSYTWILWGHPYAIVILALEAFAVSVLYRRGVKNLVLADLAFWVVVSPIVLMPLDVIVIGMEASSAIMIALKQALNGVFNALIAGLLVKLLIWYFQNGTINWLPAKVRLQELLFDALLCLTLIAGMAPIIINNQNNIINNEQRLAGELKLVAEDAVARLQQQPDRSFESQKEALSRSLSQGASGMAILNLNGTPTVQVGDLHSVLPGEIQSLTSADNLSIWLPKSGTNLVNRWKAGLYRYQLPIADQPNTNTLLIERPAAPLINEIEKSRNQSFMVLSGISFLSILAAFLLSRILIQPLSRLDKASRHLPEKIRYQASVVLPQSRVAEYAVLSTSLQDMSHALSDNFRKLEKAEENLTEEVQNRTQELARTSDLLSNILAASTEIAIIATDKRGLITLFNTGAERLLGYQSSEVVDKVSPALFHVTEEVEERAQTLTDQLNRPIKGFDTFVAIPTLEGAETCEWCYIHKQGHYIPVTLTVTAIYDDRQTITGFLGIAQDITERKRHEQMKNEFISTVSHELRTPLTSVSGALSLVRSGRLGEIPDKAQKILDTAHRNSERLTLLINDLLDIEKIAAGQLYFDMHVQPIDSILEQCLEENKAYGAERQVDIILNSETADVEVRVDKQRLKQVMANLISNAIKFSPDGASVVIDSTVNEKQVIVSVTDQGCGIAEDFRPKLFEKFAQADSTDTRQKGGTGLGLAITRELIENMSGTINVESTEGKGSRFYFQLPLYETANMKPTVQDRLTDSSVGDKPDPDMDAFYNILVVEDDPDVASLLRIMLEDSGYRVEISHDGITALSALEAKHYDLISLDLMLPDIDGLDIIRRIRQHAETADIPIVVVSAKMEEGRLALNGDVENIEWLAKPIEHKHLISLIQQQLLNATHATILHVEDDMDLHRIVHAMVSDYMTVDHALTLDQAQSLISQHTYDAILLDIGLPDGVGWNLIPQIKKIQPTASIIVLTGEEVGADRYDIVHDVLLKRRLTTGKLVDVIGKRVKRKRLSSSNEPVR